MLIDALNDTDMSVLKEKISCLDGAGHRLEKVASLSMDNRGDLTGEAFAWPDEKLFPIYSPSHALVSSVYLEGNDTVPSFVKEACEEACALFGYDVQIDALEKKASIAEELDSSDFLLPAQRKLPAVDSDSLRMSRSALEKVASVLTPEDLVIASRQLVKKASEIGDKVNDKERALGLYGTVNIKMAQEVMYDRSLETGDSRYKALLSKSKGDTIYSVEKIASLVFDVFSLDDENNLEKTAEETILSIVTPGEGLTAISIGGEEVQIEKIASIDAEDWTEVFPTQLVERLFQNGELDQGLFKEAALSVSPDEADVLLMFISQNDKG